MISWAWLKGIGAALGNSGLSDIVENISKKIPDANSRLELNLALQQIIAALQTKILDLDKQLLQSKTDIITAEAGGNGLQKSWRPILMLMFGFIIMYNYWFAPTFGTPKTELPEDFWMLLKISVGGYVTGRSVEKVAPKIAEILKKK